MLTASEFISFLSFVGTKLSRNYSEPNAASNYSNSSTINITSNGTARRSKSNGNDTYNGSLLSAETEHTYIASPGTTQAYIEHCGSSIASNQSHDGGSSQVSLLNGHSSNGSQSTIAYCGGDEFEGVPTVLEFESSRLIFQGELGRVSSSSACPSECSLNREFFFRETMDEFTKVAWSVAMTTCEKWQLKCSTLLSQPRSSKIFSVRRK